jgi:hypothetical protein
VRIAPDLGEQTHGTDSRLSLRGQNERRRIDAFVETEFRFTIKTARELEKSAGQGIAYLVARGQSVESLVLLVCYGLRWNRPKLREDDAVQLIQDFLDAGGDVNKLSEALGEVPERIGRLRPDAEDGQAEGGSAGR